MRNYLFKQAGIGRGLSRLMTRRGAKVAATRFGRGALKGVLPGAAIGGISGAINAEDGEGLSGALNGAVSGGAIGGALGGLGGVARGMRRPKPMRSMPNKARLSRTDAKLGVKPGASGNFSVKGQAPNVGKTISGAGSKMDVSNTLSPIKAKLDAGKSIAAKSPLNATEIHYGGHENYGMANGINPKALSVNKGAVGGNMSVGGQAINAGPTIAGNPSKLDVSDALSPIKNKLPKVESANHSNIASGTPYKSPVPFDKQSWKDKHKTLEKYIPMNTSLIPPAYPLNSLTTGGRGSTSLHHISFPVGGLGKNTLAERLMYPKGLQDSLAAPRKRSSMPFSNEYMDRLISQGFSW